MKRENFNLIINTLDDRALYKETCETIRQLHTIRFKLICLVPIVSGFTILTVYSLAEGFSSSMLITIGLFGAVITFFIFRWQKKNILISDVFTSYAEILETKKMELENENQSIYGLTAGPYSLLRHQNKSMLQDSIESLKRLRNTGVETAIYSATIMIWILLPILALWN